VPTSKCKALSPNPSTAKKRKRKSKVVLFWGTHMSARITSWVGSQCRKMSCYCFPLQLWDQRKNCLIVLCREQRKIGSPENSADLSVFLSLILSFFHGNTAHYPVKGSPFPSSPTSARGSACCLEYLPICLSHRPWPMAKEALCPEKKVPWSWLWWFITNPSSP
jgi:hypothetical protein